MWEYELNFNSEQIEQIVSHTWELIGNKFSYLFLSDNCASRMAQLLEAVIDQPLLPRNVPYAIPYTVFDSLAYGKYPDGKPLVKKVSLIPSRQNRFNTKYFSLTKSETDLVDLYIKDSSLLKQSNYQQLPAESKIKVIETLFDYYAFRIVKEEKNLLTFNQCNYFFGLGVCTHTVIVFAATFNRHLLMPVRVIKRPGQRIQTASRTEPETCAVTIAKHFFDLPDGFRNKNYIL